MIYNKIRNMFNNFKSIQNINVFINYYESNNIKYTQDYENPLTFIIYF